MSGAALGPALAIAASVALNASFLMQHAGSSMAERVTPRHPLATLVGLLRSPVWAAGAVVGLTGWALHVAALSRAPLSLVQAFVAGGLALAVPMAALGLRHRVTRSERVGVVLMVVALTLLALGLHAHDRHAAFSDASLGAYAGCLALAAGALARVGRGSRRAPVLGLAAGLLYGAADLAIKGLTGIGHRGGAGAVLASPWLAAAAIATAAAFFAFQRGLQIGRPLGVIALMTAGTNVSSIAGGFVVFGDPLGHTPVLATLHAAAFVLAPIAAWQLAPAQAELATSTRSVPAGA